MSVSTDQGNSGQGQEPAAGSQQQGQESAAQQGQQQGQQQGGQGQESGQQQQPQGQQFDPATIQDPATRAIVERIVRDAQEARTEAARYRTERGTLQQQVQEFQRQNESEQERMARERQEVQEERDRLAAENRDLRLGSVVRDAASNAQAFNPERVWSMIRDGIETDADGRPTNVDQLLQGLQESDPYMFRRQGGADAGAGGGQQDPPTGGMNDFIRGRGTRSRAR